MLLLSICDQSMTLFSKCTSSRRTCLFIIMFFYFKFLFCTCTFTVSDERQVSYNWVGQLSGTFTGLGLYRCYIRQVLGMKGCHVFSMYFTFLCLHVITSYPCCQTLHVYYRNPNKASTKVSVSKYKTKMK